MSLYYSDPSKADRECPTPYSDTYKQTGGPFPHAMNCDGGCEGTGLIPPALPDIEVNMCGGYWWYRFFSIKGDYREASLWNGKPRSGAFNTEAEALTAARAALTETTE